jgi:elongation factor G
VLEYAPDLRSISGGRAEHTIDFDRYEEVPHHLADRVVAAARSSAGVAA